MSQCTWPLITFSKTNSQVTGFVFPVLEFRKNKAISANKGS